MKRVCIVETWNEELIPARYGLMEKPEVVLQEFFFCKENILFFQRSFAKKSFIKIKLY